MTQHPWASQRHPRHHSQTFTLLGFGLSICVIVAGFFSCAFPLATWTGSVGHPLWLYEHPYGFICLPVLFVMPIVDILLSALTTRTWVRSILLGLGLVMLATGVLLLIDPVTNGVLMWDGERPDGTPTGGMETTQPATGFIVLVGATILQLAVLVISLVQIGVERNTRRTWQRLNGTSL